MIFTEPVFFAFLAICFTLYWTMRGRTLRHLFLLGMSFIFYGWWDWRFLILISFVILLSWGIPLLKHRYPSNKIIMPTGILTALGVLAVFKYFGFFIGSFQDAMGVFGISVSAPTLKIILPVGVSFFTFQAISYMVDVAKKTIPLEKSILRVGLYIAFFPQLVAGPIVRATDFMPQLLEDKVLKRSDLIEGTRAFVLGFIYKAIFADSLAPFVDQVYTSPDSFASHVKVMGTIGFYGQIYFDFAGYSLMAIGVSRLLGFKLPENFRFPYTATSIINFWRTWHISLSGWLRDYLYIALLGGNRSGQVKRYRNLMATMVLGGLWHGASFAFILWGIIHGGALILNHGLRFLLKNRAIAPIIMLAGGWFLTQMVALLAWVPFRAANKADVFSVFSGFLSPFTTGDGKMIVVPYALIFIPLLIDCLIVAPLHKKSVNRDARSWVYWVGLGAIFALVLQVLPLTISSFIYFQF